MLTNGGSAEAIEFSLLVMCEGGYNQPRVFLGSEPVTAHLLWCFHFLCQACRRVVEANLCSWEPRCRHCGSLRLALYDNAQLTERRGGRRLAEWDVGDRFARQVTLTEGAYFGPRCGQVRLQFEDNRVRWERTDQVAT